MGRSELRHVSFNRLLDGALPIRRPTREAHQALWSEANCHANHVAPTLDFGSSQRTTDVFPSDLTSDVASLIREDLRSACSFDLLIRALAIAEDLLDIDADGRLGIEVEVPDVRLAGEARHVEGTVLPEEPDGRDSWVPGGIDRCEVSGNVESKKTLDFGT